MWHWMRAQWQRWQSPRTPPAISEALWAELLHDYPFLRDLHNQEMQRLRSLCSFFLQDKQFTGVDGLVITDRMALAIAAQACVLLLPWGPERQALRWYGDFVGIVVYPSDILARREWQDDAGVVHSGTEEIMGEAMEQGPVVLSWPAAQAATGGQAAISVVIHEFAHKLDMAQGAADGCPPLPTGFMGCSSAQHAKQLWHSTWTCAYAQFCDALVAHERFGQPAPLLDPYAATHPAEFFAVACETFWLAPSQFQQVYPTLFPLLNSLFRLPLAR